MNPGSASLRREIARTFLSALTPALAPGAGEVERYAAREAAQMLGLTGLDRALASLHALAAGTLPRDVSSIAGRIQRLALESEAAGDTAPFANADVELGELAGEIESYEWQGGDIDADPGSHAVATLPLDRVFESAVLAQPGSQAALSLRLTPPVAAALRAALDWLVPAGMLPRLRGEPSLLEVRLEAVRGQGVDAAHRVLATVGGNLGAATDTGEGRPGEWVVRVPSYAPRPSYLMVIQGGLRIALPWHSVLRLRMLSPSNMAQPAWRNGHPVIEFIATPSPHALEYPIVLIAHGLKRGHFVADRLVWRLTADSCVNEWGSPAVGLSETVKSEEGEIFWVADPGVLLDPVPVPEVQVPECPEHNEPPQQEHEPGPIPVLTLDDVEPLGRLSPVEEPQAVTAPTPAADAHGRAAASPAPGIKSPRARAALLADDSITARVFLTRMLLQEGFQVEAVGTASELLERLVGERWDLVLVDVDLPDGHGLSWLEQSRAAVARHAPHARLVALARDHDDVAQSRAAGIEQTLIKPIDHEALRRVVAGTREARE